MLGNQRTFAIQVRQILDQDLIHPHQALAGIPYRNDQAALPPVASPSILPPVRAMIRLRDYTDAQLAHTCARLGLGINIALHGWTRVFRYGDFEKYLTGKFAHSPLPSVLITGSGYGIVTMEAVIGVLLLLGWHLRGALVAGSLLMFLLLTGTCLIQDWGTAGDQLIYVAFFSVLLATLRHGALGIDFRHGVDR